MWSRGQGCTARGRRGSTGGRQRALLAEGLREPAPLQTAPLAEGLERVRRLGRRVFDQADRAEAAHSERLYPLQVFEALARRAGAARALEQRDAPPLEPRAQERGGVGAARGIEAEATHLAERDERGGVRRRVAKQ